MLGLAPLSALDVPHDLVSWPGAGGGTTAFGSDDAAQVRLQAALAAGQTAAWLSHLQTRERWWSPEMYAIHGLQAGTEVPADYIALVHPDDRERVQAAFAESVRTGSHQVQYRVVWPDGSVHWLEGAGRTTSDAQGRPQAITGTSTCIDARVREQHDLRFLARASAEFARSSDYEETLRRVAAMAVPHFADWCAVDMLEGGELRRLAVAHVDAAKLELAAEVQRRYPPDPAAPAGLWNVVRTGQPELYADITDDLLQLGAVDAEHLRILRSLGLRSYMGLPIVGRAGVLGVITFVAAESGRRYGERDLDLAQNLVSRAADAIQNAQLVLALRESDRRKDFLLQLTDVLRSPKPIQEVLHDVSRMLGQHFGVDRVGYGHVDEQQDLIEYDVCWTDGSVPALLGAFPASAFGQRVIDRLRAGRTVAIANVREHPLTSDNAALRTSQEVDTRAILVVPLSKAGRLRTIVYLNQRPAREWHAGELALMEEVAERTRELIERGRVEAALRESESRWRGLFERMAEGFFIAQAIRDGAGTMVDFRFLQVNPAFERLTGVTTETATGRTVTEVIPGVPQHLIAAYAKVVDTGEPAEFEVFIPVLGDRWYEARARRIAPEQFSVLFLEVTPRKAAEVALAHSAQRYRALFDSIDEGFGILEVLFDDAQQPLDYRFLEVNPAFERQAGLAGAAGRTIRELVPDIDQTYIDTYGRVALTGQPIRFESRAGALGGRWFDAFAFRIGEPAQRQVGLLFTDITERKRAQDALVEREAQLTEAQRLANIGSWSWDPVADHTDASPELLRIFGLPPGSRLPAFPQQRGTLYFPQDWERLDEAVQEALRTGTPYSVDLRAWRSGQPIWVIARGTAVHDAQGRVVGLRGTVQDITDRKQVEEALREADARKDEFLATLAHELRNPLAPLRNGLSILRLSGPQQPTAVRARELMERQMSHLVRLVDDLLDVSRVSRGKVAMKKTITSLQTVVELALETSRPLVDAAAHTLVVDLPEEPILLHADVTRMAQVLSNLLNNAAKYTPQGGRIELRAALRPRHQVRVTVQDNGIGIPADMLEQVFELFAQVGHAGDRAQGGLGIGLSLARRLVELHGGTVRAQSAGEGQGSCFVVDLPLAREGRLASDAPPAAGAVAAAARRVLVVDDNKDAAETLRVLLELEGHQVAVAHTGTEALAAALREQPDLVFLDIGLPDISGYEVAQRLRREPSMAATRLVALTGWGTESDRRQAHAAGIDLHLTKPVAVEDLARALALAA